jgi:hypothetical protein
MACDRREFVRGGAAAIAIVMLPGCASLVTRQVPLENGVCSNCSTRLGRRALN